MLAIKDLTRAIVGIFQPAAKAIEAAPPAVENGVSKSKWGYHSCDYQTFCKLRCIRKFYQRQLRICANWKRWFRKEPSHGGARYTTERVTTRSRQGLHRVITTVISPVLLKEPERPHPLCFSAPNDDSHRQKFQNGVKEPSVVSKNGYDVPLSLAIELAYLGTRKPWATASDAALNRHNGMISVLPVEYLYAALPEEFQTAMPH